MLRAAAQAVCIIVSTFVIPLMSSAALGKAAPYSTTPLRSSHSVLPEFGLLLACCSQSRSAEADARIHSLIREGIDWTRFLRLLERHGVLPLAHPNLLTCKDSIPTEVLSHLRERSTAQVRRALWLTQVLYRVIQAFAEAGIPCLPHKGPVLAQRLYGDVAMRDYCDLDLFVRPTDVASARDALRKIGLVPHTSLRPKEQDSLLACGYELGFDGLGNNNLVELQWRLLPRFYSIRLAVDDLFAGAQSCAMAGIQVQTLGDEDLALTLCAHAAKHAWSRLCWTCDIAQLIRVSHIDWSRVTARAQVLGITRILAVSMLLARRMLGAAVPAELEPIMQDPAIHTLAGDILARISNDTGIDPESIPYFRLMLRIRERASDRMRFLTRLITTPTESEWSLVKLPDCLFPLYRGVRVYRLLGRLLQINQA